MPEGAPPTISAPPAPAAPTPSAPPGNGQAQPGAGSQQYAPPTGYRLVSESDHAISERNRESAAGAKSMHERLKKLGFDKFEDLEAYGPAIQTMRDRKFDPAMFPRMFSPDADADLNGDGAAKPLTAADLNKLREEMRAESRTESAQREAEAQYAKEQEHLDKLLTTFRGTDEWDDYTADLHKRSWRQWAEENRQPYPKEHPLSGTFGFRPHTEAELAKAAEYFSGLKTKSAGAKMKAAADAAAKGIKPAPGTPAGASGGQGKPDRNPNGQFRPGGLPPREAVEAAYAVRRAKRGDV